MQRGRGGRDDFFGFGDPFAGFGGFGRPGNLISSFFGGRDPFDDPFFTRPFGSMMGPSMFGPSLFGERAFIDMNHGGFIEQQAPQSSKSKGPIIRELSDDEDNVEEESHEDDKDKKNPRKHSRLSKEPFVQDPDDEEAEEKKMKHTDYRTGASRMQPQARTYSFSSSSVTYGGPNGAYYTASTTRRTGADGVTVEESKEADATARKASHRISRGLHDKGHSVTRKLNSDGRVETMQMLHNLNQDELPGFNEAWKGSAREHLPGWNQGFDMIDNGDIGGGSRRNEHAARGWALPGTEQPSTNSAQARPKFRSNDKA